MSSKKSKTPEAPRIPTFEEQTAQNIAASKQFAESELSNLRQFGLPMAQEQRRIQEEIAPNLSGLSEALAGQARTGIDEGLTDLQREEFLSNIRANLGTNAGSQIGATALARNLFSAEEGQKDKFRNLALSLSGRQPLIQPQSFDSGFGAGQGFSAQNALLGQRQNLFNTQLSAQQPSVLGQIGGQLGGSIVGTLGAGIGNAILPGIGGIIGGALGQAAIGGDNLNLGRGVRGTSSRVTPSLI